MVGLLIVYFTMCFLKFAEINVNFTRCFLKFAEINVNFTRCFWTRAWANPVFCDSKFRKLNSLRNETPGTETGTDRARPSTAPAGFMGFLPAQSLSSRSYSLENPSSKACGKKHRRGLHEMRGPFPGCVHSHWNIGFCARLSVFSRNGYRKTRCVVNHAFIISR